MGCSKCRFRGCGACREKEQVVSFSLVVAQHESPVSTKQEQERYDLINQNLNAYSIRSPVPCVPTHSEDGRTLLPKLAVGTLLFGAANTISFTPHPADYQLGVVIGDSPNYPDILILWGGFDKDDEGLPAGAFRPNEDSRNATWGKDGATLWRRLVIVGWVKGLDNERALTVQWQAGSSSPPCFYSNADALKLAHSAAKLCADLRCRGRGTKRRVQAPEPPAAPSALAAPSTPPSDRPAAAAKRRTLQGGAAGVPPACAAATPPTRQPAQLTGAPSSASEPPTLAAAGVPPACAAATPPTRQPAQPTAPPKSPEAPRNKSAVPTPPKVASKASTALVVFRGEPRPSLRVSTDELAHRRREYEVKALTHGIQTVGVDGKAQPLPTPGTLIFGCSARVVSQRPDPANYMLGLIVCAAPDDSSCVSVLWGTFSSSDDLGLPLGEFVLLAHGEPTKESWGRDGSAMWRRLMRVGSVNIDGAAEAAVVWSASSEESLPCFYGDAEANVLAARGRDLRSQSQGRGSKRKLAAPPPPSPAPRAPPASASEPPTLAAAGVPPACAAATPPTRQPAQLTGAPSSAFEPSDLRALASYVPELRRTIVGGPQSASRAGFHDAADTCKVSHLAPTRPLP